MANALSRYRKVPDVTATDAAGRTLPSKDIRPLPAVTGTFTHTVDSGDRLDQLAFTYYNQPLQYWHICDANPQFLSPLALLSKEPVQVTRFPVSVPADPPPWAAVRSALNDLVGVEDVTVVEDVALVPRRQTVGGQQVTVTVESVSRSVLVRYNRLNVDAPALAAAMTTAGLTVGPWADGGQLGQPIVIPPAVSG
ncbi:hypothetical protein [Rugosimonospora africana]|uniref:hypothetical protein n=1 Tax=Rugosimonospora africana TaxID=556532 RepID=UPI00194342B3|nr:hypothetical protein [Rugosimonospora africana]